MSRKYMLFLIVAFCVLVLGACKSEDKIVVNLPSADEDSNSNNSSGELVYENLRDWREDESVTYEKIKCDSATKYINFVDSKYTKFWKLISNNALDAYYNNEQIIKDSYTDYIDTNDYYYVDWFEETQYSYANLLQNTDVEDKYVTNQNNFYFAYLNDLDSLYNTLFEIGEDSSPIISKSVREKLSYSLLDKVREYTVTIKEYEYLLNKEVYFEHVNGYNDKDKINKSEALDDKKSLSNNDSNIKDNETPGISFPDESINFKYVDDKLFCDIVNDYYYDVYKKYSNISLDSDEKTVELATDYCLYWIKQYEGAYTYLEGIINEEDKKVLDKVLGDWKSYLNSATTLQKDVFSKSDIFVSSYGDTYESDVIIYKAEQYRKQCIEVLEWIYLING